MSSEIRSAESSTAVAELPSSIESARSTSLRASAPVEQPTGRIENTIGLEELAELLVFLEEEPVEPALELTPDVPHPLESRVAPS